MAVWDVQVRVWLKPSVFDPQGSAVEQALQTLGHEGIEQVRVGKCMSLRVTGDSEADARAKAVVVCDTVLCNPVIETYTLELTPTAVGELA